jgi:hypothetical protein
MKRIVICSLLVAGICVSVPVTAGAEPVNAGAESVTIIAMPKPKLTRRENVSSVSCVSTTFCMAVGRQNVIYSNFSATYIDQTLTRMWDGSAWSVVQSPNMGTAERNLLVSVSCVSPTFCKAVGTRSSSQSLIMTWNGNSWLLDTVPVSSDVGVSSVSCPSTTSCFAIGSTKKTTNPTVPAGGVFMQWDGSNWLEQKSPGQASSVQSISCVSSTFCMAVGDVVQGGNPNYVSAIVTQLWDGSIWTVVPTPNTNASQNKLSSVSCVSSTYCMAVGNTGSITATSAEQTLALFWDGLSWTLSQSPNTAVDRSNSLRGVVCVSVGNCLASGTGAIGPVTDINNYPLVIRWVGSNWTYAVQPGSESVVSGNQFSALSCVSIIWCMTVGMVGTMEADSSSVSISLRPAKAALVSTAKKTLVGSKLTKNAGIVVPKGSKVALAVSKKHKKICSVVGSTVKTVRKGTCLVSVVVTTKTGQKTSGTTLIKVR